MISILILTKNEETNIAQCIQSVSWSNDIVVFDSYSTDKTCEIASSLGARVIQNQFIDYSTQREAARQVPYRHPWVLAVDADEQPDPELIQELQAIAVSDSTHSAFRLRRKDYFRGHWIKHCTIYPTWFVRFYRPEQIRYEPRAVHEYPTISGTVGQLSGHLIHDNFSKGLQDWLTRHVRYAAMEGWENSHRQTRFSDDIRNLLQFQDPIKRRRALKAFSSRLPFRPFMRFLYLYVVRLGFLDGSAGLQYCQMIQAYEKMIIWFIREQSQKK